MSKDGAKLTQADHYYATGRFADAERLLYEIVGRSPRHWGAWHRLAAASLELGKIDHAEKSARKAIEFNPAIGSFHGRLGVVLSAAGKLDEAIAAYQQALSLAPGDAAAWFNLGNAHRKKGEAELACQCYQKAVKLRPDFAKAYHNLANSLAAEGASNAALQFYDEALRLVPKHDRVWTDKGNLYKKMDRDQEAVACYQKAIEVNPRCLPALSNLGNEARADNRLEDSLDLFDRAIAIEPNQPIVLNNRGITLVKLERFAEAEASYREALKQRPDYANAIYNLGDLYAEQLQFDVARKHYEKAIAVDPEHPEAHFHLAQYYLRMGDFDKGWPLYEWRWKTREARHTRHDFDAPMWDGSDLAGKTILLSTEQGAGDTFQFIRYVRMLRDLKATVIVECSARLIALLSPIEGVDRWIAKGKEEIPPCDFQVPLLSLPWLLETRADSIPAESPYLFADPELQARWRDELSTIDGFRVGIAWQGSATNLRDRTRSIPLKYFAPLAEVPQIQLITLQKGQGAKQLAAAAFPLHNLAERLDSGPDGFVDTAAVMTELDLVITSDTSIAHLAGGLGVPVWVALNDVPEWRWQLNREDSPWYPTMRLFRQRQRGNWEELFQRIATQLEELIGDSVESG